MDLDRISTRAAEIAEMFSVRAPRVVAGDVPAWVPGRLRYFVRKRQLVVAVGTGFDDLPAVERDGALTEAIVAGDLYRTGVYKTLVVIWVCVMITFPPLVYVSVLQGIPLWVVASVVSALYVFGHLLTFALRSRRITYRFDRTVAEVMGRSVVDSMIDRDIRDRPSFPRAVRLSLAVYSPTESQRLRRLDAVFGPIPSLR